MARALAVALACSAVAGTAFVVGPVLTTQRAPLLTRSASSSDEAPFMSFQESAVPPVEETKARSPLSWLSAGLLAGMVAAAMSAPAEAIDFKTEVEFRGSVKNAKHLELCRNNKKYHKIVKDELYKYKKRQDKYPKDSVVWVRFEKKMQQTKIREEAYGDRYCGKTDGFPRTIATGEFVRGGIVVPSLMFLYIAGWIGWAGRSYLLRTGGDPQKEVLLDVPLAVTCMASGFSWPVAAWQEIVNGDLVAKEEDVGPSVARIGW